MDTDDWEVQGFSAAVPASLIDALSGAMVAAFDAWMDDQNIDEMDGQVGAAACLAAVQNVLEFMNSDRSAGDETIN